MPSFNIHLKYGILFGIREYVQKAIDEYIDCPRHHDFYNKFIELKEGRKKKARNSKIHYQALLLR